MIKRNFEILFYDEKKKERSINMSDTQDIELRIRSSMTEVQNVRKRREKKEYY